MGLVEVTLIGISTFVLLNLALLAAKQSLYLSNSNSSNFASCSVRSGVGSGIPVAVQDTDLHAGERLSHGTVIIPRLTKLFDCCETTMRLPL